MNAWHSIGMGGLAVMVGGPPAGTPFHIDATEIYFGKALTGSMYGNSSPARDFPMDLRPLPLRRAAIGRAHHPGTAPSTTSPPPSMNSTPAASSARCWISARSDPPPDDPDVTGAGSWRQPPVSLAASK